MAKKKKQITISRINNNNTTIVYFVGNSDNYRYITTDGTIYNWKRLNRTDYRICIRIKNEHCNQLINVRGNGFSKNYPNRLFLTEYEFSQEFGV